MKRGDAKPQESSVERKAPADSQAEKPVAAPAAAEERAVKAEIRNVMFHLTERASAHLENVSGEFWSLGMSGKVDFVDKTSLELRVGSGDVLDSNQEKYKERLVEGYSKIKENFGLETYVKGYGNLKRAQ